MSASRALAVGLPSLLLVSACVAQRPETSKPRPTAGSGRAFFELSGLEIRFLTTGDAFKFGVEAVASSRRLTITERPPFVRLRGLGSQCDFGVKRTENADDATPQFGCAQTDPLNPNRSILRGCDEEEIEWVSWDADRSELEISCWQDGDDGLDVVDVTITRWGRLAAYARRLEPYCDEPPCARRQFRENFPKDFPFGYVPKAFAGWWSAEVTRDSGVTRVESRWNGLRNGMSFEADDAGNIRLIETWLEGERYGVWATLDVGGRVSWAAEYFLDLRTVEETRPVHH